MSNYQESNLKANVLVITPRLKVNTLSKSIGDEGTLAKAGLEN